MAGDEGDVIAEREQFVPDRGDQRRVIAARKIRAADGAAEQDIAHLNKL